MKYGLLLLLATMTWGMSFAASKWILASYSPLWAISLRFTLAGIIGLPFLYAKKFFSKNSHLIIYSIISSLFLFLYMLFQIIGLQYTTAGKSGLLSCFYILLIPIISILVLKKKYKIGLWPLLLMAIIGSSLVFEMELDNINKGDIYTIIGAFFGALQIIFIGKIANKIVNPILFNFSQCLNIGIMGIISAFLYDGKVNLNDLFNYHTLLIPSPLSGLLVTSLFSSIIALSIFVYCQKKIAPHIIGMVLLLEVPFAALFGYIFFREVFSLISVIGFLMILSSVALVPKYGREIVNSS